MLRALCLVLGAALTAAGSDKFHITDPRAFMGLCDASAAVALGEGRFLVASDEDNILRLYDSAGPATPLKEFDMNGFLEVVGRSTEADLEGAAMVGDRVYWIGSHGRNVIGKERLNRDRLFATDVSRNEAEVNLVPVGRPYKDLLWQLARQSRFAEFNFAQAEQLPPKATGALDIEGLAATPEGKLLIGFRNPIPKGKAVVIPLNNPDEVIFGKSAKFGAALRLNLGGLGVRDMVAVPGGYIVVAGAYDSHGKPRLYRWDGKSQNPQELNVNHLARYNPEVIIYYPEQGTKRFQLLSDDGTRMVGSCPCKDIRNPAERQFRSFWIESGRD